MFAAPPHVQTEVLWRLPDSLRKSGIETDWSRARGSGPLHSFLEGPAFDRAGNFYCVDLCHGRIFRVSPTGDWTVFADYDGFPNSLKIHKDGRIFVVDRTYGVISFDPLTGKRSTVVDHVDGKPFAGLNDLTFADNGDLYFTDPGVSALNNRVGKVYRLSAAGKLELVLDGVAYSNGLVLTPEQKLLYVADTRALQVLKLSLLPDHQGVYHFKSGLFVQLSGGTAGPDGMAVDAKGNLAVAHAGLGTVWLFSAFGEPLVRLISAAGISTTNVAYGGPDNRDLYITESQQGVILRARMEVPGRPMFSHR